MEEIHEGAVLLRMANPNVAVVTINRPDARNAVNGEVAEKLESLVRQIDAEPDIRVVVLTGSGGKVFSAGADLKEVAAGNMDKLVRPGTGFAGFVHIERSTPWIAAVEGLALAGGCELALACDMIVASEGGAFGLPEVMRGLIAAAGGLFRLPRAIPRAIAIELILTADRLPTERAAEFGMVNRVAPSGKTVEVALELAQRVAANAPIAVMESLKIAKLSADFTDAQLHRLSNDAQDRVMLTEDFVEGPKAFIEKRPPIWKGR